MDSVANPCDQLEPIMKSEYGNILLSHEIVWICIEMT